MNEKLGEISLLKPHEFLFFVKLFCLVGVCFLIVFFSAFQTYAQKASLFLFLMTSCESRWAASYWPLKIAMQTEAIQLQHVQDEERFREIQLTDHNIFEEKLEDMKVLSSCDNKPPGGGGGFKHLVVIHGKLQMRYKWF